MGQRGPKPLPANVHLLRGNASRRPLEELREVNPPVEIPGIPKHLLPEARKFWKRLTPLLAELSLVAKIDQAALALVCQEWAWYVWNDEALQRDVKFAAQKRAEFEAVEQKLAEEAAARGEQYQQKPWSGGDGVMIPTPNGSFTYNPHWVARKQHARDLDRYLASFGMSPSSRGRVTPSTRQLNLPGVGEPPKDGFGAL